MTVELKPCPSCGARVVLRQHTGWLWCIRCTNCSVEKAAHTEEDVIAAWNGLRSCPFCNRPAELIHDTDNYWVSCSNEECKVYPLTDTFKNEEEAVAAWNKRVKEEV